MDAAREITFLYTGDIKTEKEVIGNVLKYMEQNFAEIISLDELAELSGLSKEYLCNLFKQEMGQSIMSFLQNIRIGHAKMLLRKFPEKDACAIGKICGFNSASYFGKVFKKVTGLTPGMYRQV